MTRAELLATARGYGTAYNFISDETLALVLADYVRLAEKRAHVDTLERALHDLASPGVAAVCSHDSLTPVPHVKDYVRCDDCGDVMERP